MLTGFSIPISEDALLLMAGAIGGICGHDQNTILQLYFWVFLACWLSAWEAYWVGRLLGPKLLGIKWFRHILTEQRLLKIKKLLERFGIFTFIVGRFIPGGVRNALFMTSGLIKMPFSLFIMRDIGAALFASGVLFYVGHLFGSNFTDLLKTFKAYQEIALVGIGAFAMIGGAICFFKFSFKAKKG